MIFKPMEFHREWEWFKERTAVIPCGDTQGIVAVDDMGRICAVCVFDSFTVDACSVHIAIDRPIVIRHGLFNEIARHAFITCDRKKMFGLVPSTNMRARKLDEHIGFRQVAVIPDAVAEGVDYIVYRLDREGCRWLEPFNAEAAA